MPTLPDRTAEPGIALITRFEGLRLTRYRDAVDKWTIGYGHLILPDEEIRLIKITTGEAKALLRKDLLRTEQGLKKLLRQEINQNQFDALVSLAFNIGIGNIGKSTLLKKINQNTIDAAALEFLKWNKAGGKVLQGLQRRREAEKTLFMTPVSHKK